MSFKIHPAIRQSIHPLIGIPGKSASGKTKSALLLARGIVGPNGLIVGICTENGRMKHYAGRSANDPDCEIPGGFSVIDFNPPFTPARYIEALEVAAKEADIVVVDSMSHEWNGEGGCLEIHSSFLDEKCGDNWQKRESLNMVAWNHVGKQHTPLVNYLMRYPLTLICCFRTKDKVKMEKVLDDQNRAKTKISTQEDVPVGRKDLVWEMMLCFAVEARADGGGYFVLQKSGTSILRREIEACGDRISVKHGEAIARWCAGASTTAEKPKSSTRSRMHERLTESGFDAETQWNFAVAQGWLAPGDTLDKWPESHLPKSKEDMSALIDAVKAWKSGN